MRFWGAFGIFDTEDWLTLLPDVRGKVIDYFLGLASGVGFWAIFHSQRQREPYVAVAVGALSMFLAPQINAVLYVWRLFGQVDWSIAFDSLVRAVPMLGAGGLVGLTMWLVAYRRVQE